MRDKELTKKLLKGPLCPNCIRKRLSWEKMKPSRFCAQFEAEPTYDIQCTCSHFYEEDGSGITSQVMAVVRKTYPTSIMGKKIENEFMKVGETLAKAMAEDIAREKP